ncbi:hypothetical protein TNCV_3395121 [Trichonephila clavipes]|nr:hypothetical protein TNCV_3395121 [Trichonephila clavipes]
MIWTSAHAPQRPKVTCTEMGTLEHRFEVYGEDGRRGSVNPLSAHKGVRMCPPRWKEGVDKSLLFRNMASDTISKA